MASYLVKSDQRLMEAKSVAQLERLVLTGLIGVDALVRTLPDGGWVRADKHPDTAQFFRADENERTMIAVSPVMLRRQAERAATGDTTEPAAADDTESFWVRTGVSTVEARGLDVLQRLYELGVVRADHGVGQSPQGPFVPLHEHPRLGSLVGGAPAPDAGDVTDESGSDESASDESNATQGRRSPETSVVIALSEEEIEYFQEEVSQKRDIADIRGAERDDDRRDVSNIILLSATDLEIIDDDESMSGDFVVEIDVEEPVEESDEDARHLDPADIVSLDEPARRRRRRRREDSDVIQLSPDDIEEFEHIATGRSLPAIDGSWDQFCRAMNLAAQRVATPGHSQELTWDLFRSMMQRPRPGRSGPSESSWHRFQTRLQAPTGRTPVPAETTWDKFRELMTTPGSGTETTWNRFVRSMQKDRAAGRRRRRDARQVGNAIAGEARIKSDVIRVAEPSGPSVRIEGLKSGDDS